MEEKSIDEEGKFAPDADKVTEQTGKADVNKEKWRGEVEKRIGE